MAGAMASVSLLNAPSVGRISAPMKTADAAVLRHAMCHCINTKGI